jgi:L-fuconate dehydratase
MRRGHYQAPTNPGLSAELHTESLEQYNYPHGPVWTQRVAVSR